MRNHRKISVPGSLRQQDAGLMTYLIDRLDKPITARLVMRLPEALRTASSKDSFYSWFTLSLPPGLISFTHSLYLKVNSIQYTLCNPVYPVIQVAEY